ncbi:MAG: ABC transporter ATP-binding protein/permease [Lachnospiraceae bacterium]|nr:ABC transporter ATP-binding protein/permease [Lachnospiraceae bacterium]
MTDRQYFFRIFSYVKPYRVPYAIGTFIYCSQQFIFPLMISFLFGGVTAAILAGNYSGVLDAIWQMLIMLLTIIVFLGIGTYLYIVNLAYAVRDLSLKLFKSFMKSSIESNKHSGEGIAALNTDIDMASNIISDALASFLQNILAVLLSTIAVFIIDFRMGLGVLAIGLLILFMQSRFARPLARLGKEQLITNADSVKSLSNIFAGALTIRAYNRQDRSLIQFDKENGKLKKLAFKQAFIGMWQDLFNTVQGWLTIVFIFGFGGWLVISGGAEFSLVMMVLPLAGTISASMSQIGTSFAALQPPIVAAKRVFDIIDSAPETDSNESEEKAGLDGKYEIKIDNLNFSYKDTTFKALNDINLLIGQNKMVAFVGESGSGKSTLLRVIIGMYERENLKMKIGGLPFAVENINEWRSQFAYVDQSCKLFDMTVAENISLGLNGKATEEQIIEASKRAYAHDFILGLTEGYETACGENGASLSGGQKQRLAIARALVRKAPVLVFDEATSALDSESERSIMETIEDLRSDHTVLITTHNLANIVTADMIVVMDKGRAAESGTHSELLDKGGLYVKLLEGRE